MKHLRLFESFKDIHSICKKYGIKNYTINEDESIDVYENVYLDNFHLTKLPLKFRNVSGDFFCNNNKLTSLEGCPESVGGNFACSYNELTSLEGCPKSVGNHFFCYNNKLSSLEGCPELVGDHFYCHNNEITTFEHLPFSIGGSFYCNNNPIYRIWDLFWDYSKIELFNYYDIIQDGVIILDRLNVFLEEIGKPTVVDLSPQLASKVFGYKCK